MENAGYVKNFHLFIRKENHTKEVKRGKSENINKRKK
jgi:hypothetical protein